MFTKLYTVSPMIHGSLSWLLILIRVTCPPVERNLILPVIVTYLYLFVVDSTKYMVGSYGPKQEVQSYTTPVEEAPSGMLARGSYTVKSLFTDDDKHEHLKWEWTLEIKKDWE